MLEGGSATKIDRRCACGVEGWGWGLGVKGGNSKEWPGV